MQAEFPAASVVYRSWLDKFIAKINSASGDSCPETASSSEDPTSETSVPANEDECLECTGDNILNCNRSGFRSNWNDYTSKSYFSC